MQKTHEYLENVSGSLAHDVQVVDLLYLIAYVDEARSIRRSAVHDTGDHYGSCTLVLFDGGPLRGKKIVAVSALQKKPRDVFTDDV